MVELHKLAKQDYLQGMKYHEIASKQKHPVVLETTAWLVTRKGCTQTRRCTQGK